MTTTTRMNPEIKAQWLAALRGGDYRQTQGMLGRVTEHGEEQFCCLGVLCELAVKAGEDVDSALNDSAIEYDGDSETLPLRVQVWAGLSESSPIVPFPVERVARVEYNGRAALGELNDGAVEWADDQPVTVIKPHSFAEIADLIEKYL